MTTMDKAREKYGKAMELLEMATVYAEDGAPLTAADRAEAAAKLFREANADREAVIGGAA